MAAAVFDALFAARDYGNFNFNYTPLVVVAAFYVAMTVAPGALHRLAAATVDGTAEGRCPVNPPLLDLHAVRKTYGDRLVLDDVDLTVERHDVGCLIGSSGSGKSTLLRLVDLLEPVDEGTIHLEGTDVTDPRLDPRSVRKRIGPRDPRDELRAGRATTVCFLHEGRILEQGPPDVVLTSPREERTRQFLRRVLPT